MRREAVQKVPRVKSWIETVPKPWVMLAPMAGVTGWAFREICFRFGADVCVSEFHPAIGVVGQPKRLLPLIGARHGDQPFVVQLFGRNPTDFRRAARILADETSAVGLDINMGCPVDRVVNSVHGCALMNEPSLQATSSRRRARDRICLSQ